MAQLMTKWPMHYYNIAIPHFHIYASVLPKYYSPTSEGMQFHLLCNIINTTETGNSRETMPLLKDMKKKTQQWDQFEIGLDMAFQDSGRTSYKHWYKTGRILEVLPHKQNQVKLNGQVE